MARPEVFLSSILITIVALTSVYSCKDARSGRVVKMPATYRLTTDANFSKIQDTLYYGATKFSGYAYELSEQRDTLLLAGYLDGLEEGSFKKWYPNRQLQQLRYYTAGKKNGIHTGWWENGNKTMW